ncbi:MAG: VOC family protein [Acidimicrobiales bacterium]|nr:VOC family protein [Acidimicrobiales bacterium]
MAISRLNHAVLYVRDAEASAAFYRDVLDFEIVQSFPGAAFLRAPGSANDHDLGLFSIGAAAGRSDAGRRTVGLYHLAWEVETLAEIGVLARRLTEAGALVGASDHGVSKSLYARDPDGIEFEVCWVVPVEDLSPADTSGPVTRALDLAAALDRFGPDALSRSSV